MDIKQETAARESHTKILGKRLLETPTEATLITHIEENPEQLFHIVKWHQALSMYKRLKAENKPDLPSSLPNPWGLNLPSNIQDKKRHYWFWS
jgi:hypothetical protein